MTLESALLQAIGEAMLEEHGETAIEIDVEALPAVWHRPDDVIQPVQLGDVLIRPISIECTADAATILFRW